jgi:hypothetical protein
MKSTIGFIGRLSAVLLITIFLEGMFTLGSALDFENYSAMGVVFQALMFCVAVWAATEWHYGSFKN